MLQHSEQFRNIDLDEIRERPELIIEMLFNENDVSMILEKRGNSVRYACLRTYDNECGRILDEAEKGYLQKKKDGYSKDQAFVDLTEALEEITAQLNPQADEKNCV